MPTTFFSVIGLLGHSMPTLLMSENSYQSLRFLPMASTSSMARRCSAIRYRRDKKNENHKGQTHYFMKILGAFSYFSYLCHHKV